MARKIILGVVLFLLLGEAFVRIDQKFTFLSNNSVVKIVTTIGQTPEYEALTAHTLDTSCNSLRILVLGDSYIHGGGIDFQNNFSQQLKTILGSAYSHVIVLDVSVPSSNTLDNLNAYRIYEAEFKPDIIILGYNYNDVLGNLDKDTSGRVDKAASIVLKRTNGKKNQSTAKKIYDILFQSKLLNYVLTNINEQLKAHGVIIPGTEFDNELTSYTKDKPNWEKSKLLLAEMISCAKQKGSVVVVMKFPEMNLLDHPTIFEGANKVIAGFFSGFDNVRYISVGDIFKNESPAPYLLSRYDGHPNELAHKKIASFMAEQLNKLPVFASRSTK